MPTQACRHPLARHWLGLLRDATLPPSRVRSLAEDLAALLALDALADLPLAASSVTGWAGSVETQTLADPPPVLVPVLRAGLGMLPGVQRHLPDAPVGVLGYRRDEHTLQPHAYYTNLGPAVAGRMALLLDPMLATGGSLIAAADTLRAAGCASIRVLCLVAAPEGLAALDARHPQITVYTAAVDAGLNDVGYILPGLGDAGDRLFGTAPG